jgi:hypothetical protein
MDIRKESVSEGLGILIGVIAGAYAVQKITALKPVYDLAIGIVLIAIPMFVSLKHKAVDGFVFGLGSMFLLKGAGSYIGISF